MSAADRDPHVHDVVIVGAGLAGLVAATALAADGADVVLLDKSRSAGGRLATRRVEGATLDHGAQFFTVRSEAFAGLLEAWRAAGMPVRAWSHGLPQAPSVAAGPAAVDIPADGHPRYIVDGGMNALAQHLAERLEVRERRRVSRADAVDGRWRISVEGLRAREVVEGRRLLLTPPVPQSLALLPPDAPRAEELTDLGYAPCVSLLAVLSAPPALPWPGGVQIADGPIGWLADNQRKGLSVRPALTAHATDAESTVLADLDDATAAARLGSHVAPWLGDGRPVAVHVKRWRYARPLLPHPERAVSTDVDGALLVFAGDAFGEARVEGAARSGLAAAERLA
ncbi:MAG: FAD-dependent oxidoreductase [Egibacteraceae bacterium]